MYERRIKSERGTDLYNRNVCLCDCTPSRPNRDNTSSIAIALCGPFRGCSRSWAMRLSTRVSDVAPYSPAASLSHQSARVTITRGPIVLLRYCCREYVLRFAATSAARRRLSSKSHATSSSSPYGTQTWARTRFRFGRSPPPPPSSPVTSCACAAPAFPPLFSARCVASGTHLNTKMVTKKV